MIKTFLKKSLKLFFSFRMRFILIFLMAMGLGIGVFFAGKAISSNYIENVYVAEENKKAREEGYLADLQDFINQNKISSAETGKISEWARENQYVYLLIYKDDKIFFTSDDANKEEEKDEEDGKGDSLPEDGEEEKEPPKDNEGNDSESDGTDDNIGDKDENGKKDESGKDETNPGVTVQYPTREELFAYAKKNDMHLIELADGPLFASFAEFTEYLYYDLSNIFSLVAAALIIVIIMLVYIQRVTGRIVHLENDVNRVALGDTEHQIKARGKDEIANLATNVDNMRSSLIETVKKEREALDSNAALITSMSHDIRTPLTVLLGYIDVMRAHSGDDEEMQSYIKAAESTALRLKKLSDDMFAYFVVFSGKGIEAELEAYDANMLLEQMLAEHILLMKENGYTVNLNISPEFENFGKNVMTDAQKLVRIFDNAFSNLYKYADKSKPVEISILVDPCKVNIEIVNDIRTDGETVESNGIGLKTCAKLSELIGSEFLHGAEENKFFVKLSLPIEE